MSLWQYISAFLVSIILVFGLMLWSDNSKINGLQETIVRMKQDAVSTQMNLTTCKSTVIDQNKAIDAMASDSLKKEKELQQWENQPAVVKYKTIYKYGEQSNDCKDIEDKLDHIRDINFSGL